MPRVNQYFAVKSAQEYVKRHEGGIIWHTQGSGKSIIRLIIYWICYGYSRVAMDDC